MQNAANVRVLGRCKNYLGEILGETTLLVETKDKLRYAVCGCGDMRGGSLSSGRILQLGRIADWVAGGKLPARVETSAVVEKDAVSSDLLVTLPTIAPWQTGYIYLKQTGVYPFFPIESAFQSHK